MSEVDDMPSPTDDSHAMNGIENNTSDNDNVFDNDLIDAQKSPNSNSLQPDYGVNEDRIPRRSSMLKDASHRKQRKKTVSFSSMPGKKTVINAQDCLNYMQNGSELIKVRSNSRQYQRIFTVDADLREIRWQPSSKKPNKAKISLIDVKEVRIGKNTDILRNGDIAGHYADECAFSIIYGADYESMDLVASSADEVNIWVTGLTCLIALNNSNIVDNLEGRQQMRDRWLMELFNVADIDNNGHLNEHEVIKLIKNNSNLSTIKVQQKLKEYMSGQNSERGRLSSTQFINLFKEISTRPEIYFLLVRYASDSDFMSTDDLLLFLEAEQEMTRVSKEKCLEIIHKYEPSSEGQQSGKLGIDGFTQYLQSDECDIFYPEHLSVCQDMSQPLTHYFIASSHNTYLMQDQLKGPSSTEGYVRALQKGCRCIELDCWDGPNDEPIIYHGHTLTSRISFKAVMHVINKHAFLVSSYPVILSIENHCSIKQQQQIAHHINTILGDQVYRSPPDTTGPLPSPEFLKNKFLVKSKKLAEDKTSDENGEGYVTEEDENQDSEKLRKSSKREGSLKKQKLAKELSDLVTYCKSVRFVDFQVSSQNQSYYEMCSFSESSALRLANTCPEDFVNYNKKFLSRIYPNGMRVDSSNFNPQDLWNYGCQFVALNYQTAGPMMDLNDGKFMQNGGCGYVLKPSIMCDDIAYFSPHNKDSIPGVTPQLLKVKIISGQQLPKPRAAGAKGDTIDPYITVDIIGIPSDCTQEKTRTVRHDGYNPIFDESFEFQINLPEMALVRFTVLDDDFIGDEFIAQYTIPFDCIQTGFRHIHMKSNIGEPIPNCSLFVHISINNKDGGGNKLNKRGLSVRRSNKHREYTSMKSIGIKNVDETFKLAIQPLRDGADLRDNVSSSLATFKENCGLAPTSNLKQCLRLLSTRMSTSCCPNSLQIAMRGEYPILEAEGNIPDVFKKALSSFESFIMECKNLMDNGDAVYCKLIHITNAGLEWREELASIAQQNGFKGKKFNKVLENFAWNIRVLKGQADLLKQMDKECQEYIKQIQESGISLSLIKSSQSQQVNNEMDQS